jgi:hypothetical protein
MLWRRKIREEMRMEKRERYVPLITQLAPLFPNVPGFM